MEVAGLVIGVAGLLPVILEVIRAFQTVHTAMKTVKKCISEVESIVLDLEVQKDRFRSECLVLLAESVSDGQLVGKLMAMTKVPLWYDEHTEGMVSEHLKESKETFRNVINRMRVTLQEIESDIRCFDLVRDQRGKGERMKTTFRRLQKTVQFVFDQSKLEKKITRIACWNRDLKALRESQADLRKIRTAKPCVSRCASRQGMPRYLSDIQRISHEAFGALTASFTCNDPSHEQHSAALCLDVVVFDEISLSMAITVVKQCPGVGSQSETEPAVKFVLKSKTTAVQMKEAMSDTNNSNIYHTLQPQQPHIVPETDPKALAQTTRKRKVMFVDDLEDILGLKSAKPAPEKLHVPTREATKPSINLRALESACEYLHKQCGCRGKAREHALIAFFQKPSPSQYIFYISTTQYSVTEDLSLTSGTSVSLLEFVGAHEKDSISIVHQFKLALKLTMGVLQYHSTPWLGEEWHLSQLLLLGSAYEIPEDFKLYLNSALPAPVITPESPSTPDTQMTGTRKKEALSDTERLGINNTVLFCLGMAMLQIGYWKPLADLEEDYDNHHIDTARRLSFGSSGLGACYDEIIRKCLRCDFGFGTDLSRTELQSAIYSDVVCPLEGLINKLSNLSI